ncbi:MAG: hypothetical protein HKL92_04740 [Candidatus Eremiobacteraeota bacterium]|nr:hypothetical protein [Candidatus Eremiobacteraeota bacterium]NNM92629.1 hypothetical protein [Candidatus Eremiobacteraeota bacterium]
MRVLAMLLLVIAVSSGVGVRLLSASPLPRVQPESCAVLLAALKDPKQASAAKGVGDLYCIDGPIAEVRMTPASRLKGNILEDGDRVRIIRCARAGPHPVVTVLSLRSVLAGRAPMPIDEISCASKMRTIHIEDPSPPSPLIAGFEHFMFVVATLFRERNLSLSADVSRGTSSDTLRSSMLSSPQLIPEGVDRISIGWAGGAPPFRVEFASPGEAAVSQIATMHRSLIDVPVDRSTQRIDLQIVDKAGSHIACTIERSENRPPGTRATSVERRAVALLGDPRRRWRLYAFSLVAPKRGKNLVAKLLAGRLSGAY